MTTDVIADMLTRIRNANQRMLKTVNIPSSKMKLEIANILKEEGFISSFTVEGEVKKTITIELKYQGKQRVISGLKKISKPGLRVYAPANEIPQVLNGLGIAIVSTSQGIMTGKQARLSNIGGEVLAFVW
ncbi:MULTISPECIES: 30S ribosomal protein S8 [Mesoplasma]|uniref:Small ribosomal subunit protein uS8 n=4 Tax=Mesoplasma TaxID=46239 RepID=RS8_MESFL|nr:MULTISPECIES: 30S ribosomal protein S8 [Mesoplasma]Q6F1Y0.1 RecName: Full=Small ribosomal subunit protein uS8; AltName: Full=30S ribosomal protein S8 [Mesoplasma florum L1]AAT75493.1 30S ribosomal protein S8 [Mesoplasma florum L1]ATI73092.1 30S ribosomal protein S8 [Mesoplasma florum]ATQ35297.1 30S ribosomal protein S8 [Mesoplasma entomophilum]ATZ19247.1 30S ribosomal protein S8 [Mesoplasma entomophilum]ATZ20665.1 30S ribosomal protein S8 [Mesoplasma coleopterae]